MYVESNTFATDGNIVAIFFCSSQLINVLSQPDYT